MITLLNGKTAEETDLAFNSVTYHFTQRSTGADVTNLIRRSDKLELVRGFDVARDNYRLSAEKRGGSQEPLTTSTAEIFADQVLNKPLDAPLETLDAGVNKILKSSGIQTILIVAALGIAALIMLKK